MEKLYSVIPLQAVEGEGSPSVARDRGFWRTSPKVRIRKYKTLIPALQLVLEEKQKNKGDHQVKKSLVLALVGSFVLSAAGTAFAFPVDFNGDFKYEFRQNKDFQVQTNNQNRFYTDLKFNGKIDESTTFFSRIGGQVIDTRAAHITSGFTMDQFGVKTTSGNWNFALGRQGTQLGQGGVFYAGNDIDPLSYFDGVVASTKMGDFDVKVIGGKAVVSNSAVQASNISAYPAQSWVGIDLKVPVDQVTLGFAYAGKSVSAGATDAKYWGLNAATKIVGVDFSAEYVKSNAATNTSAFTLAGSYAWDQDRLTVAYNNVKANAVDDVNSNLGAIYYPTGASFNGTGYKGFTYAYHHDITKAMAANAYLLVLQPLEGVNQGHKNNELGLNVKWSF